MKLLKIGSQTRTMRAQEILSAAGIRNRRRKITDTADGCGYAISVELRDTDRAVSVLRASGIAVKQVTEDRS